MQSPAPTLSRAAQLCAVFAIALLALLILGYHPFAEDGGIYLAALLQRLHPAMFPHAHNFAAAHLGKSLYLAGLATLSAHLPMSPGWLLALLHATSTGAIVLASYLLATQLGLGASESLMATALVAAGLSLPVAGTALYIADPYITARSVSTPLILFALLFLLRQRLLPAAVLAACTIALHPLMGLWGTTFLVAVWCSGRRRHLTALAWFMCSIFVACAAIVLLSPAENGIAYALAQTRSYWYLARWQWYEWIGILAPVALLGVMYRHSTKAITGATQTQLATAIVATFALACCVSVTLVVPASHHLLLARMQPLRMLQMPYLVFLLLLGGRLATWAANIKQRQAAIWAALAAASLILFTVQRGIYPSSAHIELPTSSLRSPWAQAFVWISNNTPQNAVVAMDPRYTSALGGDAQNARPITQRSTLPDYSKDGGVASVQTSLGDAWKTAVTAQAGIENMTDIERRQRLQPLGVNWIVLRSTSKTQRPCPYNNATVKVCTL